MSSLNLRQMLNGEPNRLRYITRFSTALLIHKENVAEHTFYVAFFAMLIGTYVNQQSHHPRINMGELLQRALVHDLDEARTGDFYRPFKYSDPQLLEALRQGAEKSFVDVAKSVYPERVLSLFGYWKNAKDSTEEGKIVAFADYLSVLSHVWQEISVHNILMLEHTESMREYVKEFEGADFDFIKELVSEVKEITDEVLSGGKIHG